MLKKPVAAPPPQPKSALPFMFTFMLGMIAILMVTPLINGESLIFYITAPFGLESEQLWWYVTRAAGMTAYILVWLSTMWGFIIGSKIFDSILDTSISLVFHEILSLLGLGFSLMHAAVLLVDRFIPFSLTQIMVPFLSPYRPFWVGTGTICFYLALLVSLSFYVRRWISQPLFRLIHVLSIFSYLGILFHALFAGTDSGLSMVLDVYKITFLSSIFLGTFWVVRQNGEKN